MVALPFLANKRAEFSLGYGQLEDNYFQSSVIDFDKDRSDRSTYKLLGGFSRFIGSTLNTRQYATKGYLEKLIAQVFTGRERLTGESARRRVQSFSRKSGNHGYKSLI